ncbi:MAG: tetratricopeptide repeat protein [Acidobacteriota bacterium]
MNRAALRVGTVLAVLLSLTSVGAGRADVIHLKNGGLIDADSWEERGDDLIVLQGGLKIVVPRSEVARIERLPAPPTGPAERPPEDGARPAEAGHPDLTPAQIDRRLADLKRRLRNRPDARAENTRRIVSLLNSLGTRAYKRRDFEESLSRFREALRYDRRDPGALLGLAATYFAQGRDIYARSTLESALVEHPRDARLMVLLGDVYNSQERPEDALEIWRRANEIAPHARIDRRIEKLRREHRIDGDYLRSEAAHFTLKYDGERSGADLGARILEHLEAEFTRMVVHFDYYPRQPIVVIVYPQRQFYEATRAERNVGGLYDGKIRVPIGGLEELDGDARSVLIHELAHAFISGKSRGTAPRWLHEGIAQQVEGRTISPAEGRELAAEYSRLGDTTSWGTSFTYVSALSFIDFLAAREGFFRILEVLEALAEGATLDEAFEAATRYTLAELRRAWGEALAAEYLK